MDIYCYFQGKKDKKRKEENKNETIFEFFSAFILVWTVRGLRIATFHYNYAVDAFNSYTSPTAVWQYIFWRAPLLTFLRKWAVVNGSTGQNGARFGVSASDATYYLTGSVSGGTGSITAILPNAVKITWAFGGGPWMPTTRLPFIMGATTVASFTG